MEDEPEISIYQVRGHDVAPFRPATPRALSKYGFIKTTYGIYESAGPKAMLRSVWAHSQSEWQTENDKEATAANKEKCRQWSRVSGRERRGGEQSGGKAAWKVLPTYLSLGHF